MATAWRAGAGLPSGVTSVPIVDDKNPRRRTTQLRRAALTVTGTLAVTAATAFVIKTGVAATTVSEASNTPAPRTVVATAGPRITIPPATAVTVTLSPSAAETPISVAPTVPAMPADTPAAQPIGDPREIVYTVAGNQRPEDPVTIVYADDTGTLRTIENVGLPWTMAVIPSPDAPVNYVTATSFGSQLNCWITDATGATVTSQVQNTITATCNR